MHRASKVLPNWADAFNLPKKTFMLLKALSMLPDESTSELFCFMQFTFLGEKNLRVDENRTHWNPIAIASLCHIELAKYCR